MKTEQELKELALGIVEGEIFTDRSVRQASLVQQVFMPLALMDADNKAALKEADPQMFYASMKSALPRSVNGYPIFFEVSFLNSDETDSVDRYIDEIQEFRQAFLNQN